MAADILTRGGEGGQKFGKSAYVILEQSLSGRDHCMILILFWSMVKEAEDIDVILRTEMYKKAILCSTLSFDKIRYLFNLVFIWMLKQIDHVFNQTVVWFYRWCCVSMFCQCSLPSTS